MSRIARRTRLAAPILVLGALLIAGCGKKAEDSLTNCTSCAEQYVAQANAALGGVMHDLMQSPTPPPSLSSLDFRTADALYRQALAADPNNLDAHFGVAVTGLLTLSTDTEVNAAFDEWGAYMGSHTPFTIPGVALAPMGVPLALGSPNALRLPFGIVPMSLLAQSRHLVAEPDPQIGRVQTILRERVLTRLQDCIAHLYVVGATPGYVFTVTPQMQGDDLASPIEIDLTDIHALRAAANLLASLCHTAVAYELNLAAYDSSATHQALTPGSGWMALRADGAAHMSSAGTSLEASLTDLALSIQALRAETDNQNDDVIKVDPRGMSRADLDSLDAWIPRIRSGFLDGFVVTEDWDGDPGTPAVPLHIAPHALFATPVADWKALLPPYTVRHEVRALGTERHFVWAEFSILVTTDSSSFYQGQFYLSCSQGRIIDSLYVGAEALHPGLRYAAMHAADSLLALPGSNGRASLVASFDGFVLIGGHVVPANLNGWYETSTAFVFAPILRWNATSYTQWESQWPSASLNGLLPEMTSAHQLLTMFGMRESAWQRDFPLFPPDAAGTGSAFARAASSGPSFARTHTAPRSIRPR
ncbi:MAG: hypothetical protein RLZ94_2054 [Actinomycetota bacterium]